MILSLPRPVTDLAATLIHRLVVCPLVGWHDCDWVHEAMTGVKRCQRCRRPIP